MITGACNYRFGQIIGNCNWTTWAKTNDNPQASKIN